MAVQVRQTQRLLCADGSLDLGDDGRLYGNPNVLFVKLQREHGLKLLMEAGLAAYPRDKATGKSDTGRPPYFRFWKWPLLFPFRSRQHDRVVYLQARHFGPKPNHGRDDRWQNVGGTIPSLWNDAGLLHLAPGAKLYLCEGIPDALTLEAVGLHAVACLGIGNLQERMLVDLLPFDVVLVGDQDAGGDTFNEKVSMRFAAYGKTVRIKRLPAGTKDVNECFVKGLCDA